MKQNSWNRYIEYLKDNPHGYWFKRKVFGWGWVPVTWQGWLVTILYIVIILALGLTIDESSPPKETFFILILPLILLTGALIRIAYRKGEKPRWQWGIPQKDEEEKNKNSKNF